MEGGLYIIREITLSIRQARRFLLSYHRLLPPGSLKGKKGILDYVKKAGCIQYDPLNIVGRNAELVLQSRVKDFTPDILDELLYKDRLLIDGWDKMMSLYCIEDWPYFKRVRNIREKQVKRVLHRRNSDMALSLTSKVVEEIRKRGALSSHDFDLGSVNPGSWGHGKLASAALNYLFHKGELGIEKKINTRKVYNLIHRLIPSSIYSIPDPFDKEEDFFEWYYLRRIGSTGLIWNKRSDAWLGYILENKEKREKVMKLLLEKHRISEININGIKNPFYIKKEDEVNLINCMKKKDYAKKAAIIAPLDNMLWDRNLIKTLFNFSYSWEVYVPAHKRKYGYYVLPVLYEDQFIARFEPARDKKNKLFIIKNWWWEENIQISNSMKQSIIECIKDFMRFLGTVEIHIEKPCKHRINWLKV